MNMPEENKVFDCALEIAKDFAGKLLLDPLSELSGILSDTIGYWRLRNQITLLLKAKKWLERKGVNPTKIVPDIFVPLIKDGENVENETLSDMFASLLTCHLDPSCIDTVHPSYTKLLVQMSSVDAKIMIKFRGLASAREYRELGLKGAPMSVNYLASTLSINNRIVYLSCLNLERLGIIERAGFETPEDHSFPEIFQDSMEHQKFIITEYGIVFNDACNHISD